MIMYVWCSFTLPRCAHDHELHFIFLQSDQFHFRFVWIRNVLISLPHRKTNWPLAHSTLSNYMFHENTVLARVISTILPAAPLYFTIATIYSPRSPPIVSHVSLEGEKHHHIISALLFLPLSAYWLSSARTIYSNDSWPGDNWFCALLFRSNSSP